MADDTPTMPVYHSPTALRGRLRRSSTRRSFTSTATPLPPAAKTESPRTLCPRDGDAFSYLPNHLPAWYISQELWQRLPQQLQVALASMQHAGAAVLTGFERLEQHSGHLDIIPEVTSKDQVLDLEAGIHSLPNLPPKLRTVSTSSSQLEASISSSVFLPSPSSTSASPSSTYASQTTSPISPMCLTPSDAQFALAAERPRERSFSIPLPPHSAYYATELSQLRTESLPRLRHSVRRVDTQWHDIQRGALTADDANDFENWLAEKKNYIHELNEKGNRLSVDIGLAPTGMGWSAP